MSRRTHSPAVLHPEFTSKLKHIYTSNSRLAESWKSEGKELLTILPLIQKKLEYGFSFNKPLAVGGSGVAILVEDIHLKVTRVLKVSRPSPGKTELLSRLLMKEADTLHRFSHQNIIRIVAKGTVPRKPHPSPAESKFRRDSNRKVAGGATNNDLLLDVVPFYVMDFIEGASEVDTYFASSKLKSERDVLSILTGIVAALRYMHEQNTLHLDIKPSNIFVNSAGIAILADLGFAKHITLPDGNTIIGGTKGYMHPDAAAFVENLGSDPNRMTGSVGYTTLKQRWNWDLYPLGKTFLDLLRILDGRRQGLLSPYARRYLRLMACRLLDGRNSPSELALGIAADTFSEVKYSSATEVSLDLEKLTGTYNLSERVPELDPYYPDIVQVCSHSKTPLTDRISAIKETHAFKRLDNVTQLGFINLVYPPAVHTRYSHSIGVYSATCKIIASLYHDPLNPLFKQLMTETDLHNGLVAALLHDLGQYPLAHDLEEADYTAFNHESMTLAILNQRGEIPALLNAQERTGVWSVSAERVIAILKAKPSALEGTLKDRILHSIIDGPFDADKLDYLVRDSEECKLKHAAGFDLERLRDCVTIVVKKHGHNSTYASLGIHEKGKIPAEDVAWLRYKMFGTVYWHHTYRALKSMLCRAVWDYFHERGMSESDAARAYFDAFGVLPSEPTELGFQLGPENLHFSTRKFGRGSAFDHAAAEFFCNQTKTGKALYELISERRLFKRIMVASKAKFVDAAAWDKIVDLFSFDVSGAGKWKIKRELQRKAQEQIVAYFKDPKTKTPSKFSKERKKLIQQHSRNEILILIDVPPKRLSGSKGVEYIVEEDRYGFKADTLQVATLEESTLYTAIQSRFHDSIGKLRVFCHPDFREFLSASAPRDIIEKAILNNL